MSRPRLPEAWAVGAAVALASSVGCAPPPEAPRAPAAGHDHHGGGHDPLAHRFERAEDWVARFEGPGRDAWQEPGEVVALVGVTAGMTVADIGAGTGYFLPYLARAVGPGGHVLALDIEPDMVRYMKERAAREGLTTVEARVVAGDDPALPDASVDRILIVDTWHHIPEREAYAKKLSRALKPGGLVAIVDFTGEAHEGPPKEHRVPLEVVVRELSAGGLTAGAIDEPLPEQYIVIGKK